MIARGGFSPRNRKYRCLRPRLMRIQAVARRGANSPAGPARRDAPHPPICPRPGGGLHHRGRLQEQWPPA